MERGKTIFTWFLKDKKRVFVAVVSATALIFVYFSFFKKESQEPQIQTAEVERGNIVSTISASGVILTANTLPITTSATGIVKEVYVKDGDNVKKTQKLLEIELDSVGSQKNASAYASYISASNSLVAAKNNLRSAEASLAVTYDEIKGHDTDESLKMKETRTKAEVSKDNAYLSVVNAQVNLASSSLSYQASSSVIYAPSSGTIENITVVSGMVLAESGASSSDSTSQGERIAVIKTKGAPLASFNISEIDVSKVNQGQKATITVDAIPDKTFTGKVVTVDKIGTSSSGVTNYPVTIQLDTEAPEILPNMAATANIILESKNDVLIIPSSAITTSNGLSTVRVLHNSQEEVVVVESGLSGDSGVEILTGLSEGDIVAIGTASVTSSSGQTQSVFSPGGFGGFRGGGSTQIRVVR